VGASVGRPASDKHLGADFLGHRDFSTTKYKRSCSVRHRSSSYYPWHLLRKDYIPHAGQPDGCYIAVLRVGPEILLIFNVRAKTWTELTKIAVNLLRFGRGVSSSFTLIPLTTRQSLYRVRIAHKKLETLVSLRGMRFAPVWGSLNGLTRDDSPFLVVRYLSNQDIYSLDLELP
jgi:hypothetical protein